MKAIGILGLEEADEESENTQAFHDNPCHTTSEGIKQRPPLKPVFATVAIGRKGKCGRKRTGDRVPVAEDKDRKAKGVDNHEDYKEAVKSVLRRVVQTVVECN
jgi:hypothetical protein